MPDCSGCGTDLKVGPRLRKVQWAVLERHEEGEQKYLCVFCEASSTLSLPRYQAYYTDTGSVLHEVAAMLNVLLDRIEKGSGDA